MNRTLLTAVILLLPLRAFAQSGAPPDAPPITPPGHEVIADLNNYNYVEPGDLRISIHGMKFGGEYTGTFSLNDRHHWFFQTNIRGNVGNTNYDGWCAPWLLTPDRTSPNGYFLDIGDYSTCNDSGNRDWNMESRVLAGKDFVGQHWTWTPEAGVAARYLSNSLDGIGGYRTDKYLYVPVGMTIRTKIGAGGTLSFNAEYDHLLRGWQHTHDSAFGGGDFDATDTAPAFTINSMTDVAFDQHKGWGLRGGMKYEVNRHVSLEPYFIHWQLENSTIDYETLTFTVRGISAQEQLGFLEPKNSTNELGVKLGFRIR